MTDEEQILIATFMGGMPCDRCENFVMWIFDGKERMLSFI